MIYAALGPGERLRKRVAEADRADEDRLAGRRIPVAAEIAQPLELHRLVGVRRRRGRLEHRAGQDLERVRIEVGGKVRDVGRRRS